LACNNYGLSTFVDFSYLINPYLKIILYNPGLSWQTIPEKFFLKTAVAALLEMNEKFNRFKLLYFLVLQLLSQSLFSSTKGNVL